MRLRHHTSARAAGGFSLIELMVAITILTVALGAISSALVATTSLNNLNREMMIALDAAHAQAERLRGETFAEVFARYNADPADDPPLPIGKASPGNNFNVPRLNTRPDDADGFVGEIFFPTIGAELREDAVDADLGMPRDLDLNTAVDSADHANDYRILPVRIRLQWTGENGRQTINLVTVLGEI